MKLNPHKWPKWRIFVWKQCHCRCVKCSFMLGGSDFSAFNVLPLCNNKVNKQAHLSWSGRSVPVWALSARASGGWPRRRARWPGGVPGCTGPRGRAAGAARRPGSAPGYQKLRTSPGWAPFSRSAARCPHSTGFVSRREKKVAHFRNGIQQWMHWTRPINRWKRQRESPAYEMKHVCQS